MICKILLPACKIPINSNINKRNGTIEYTIKDKIVIYDDCRYKKEIPSERDSRFIVNDHGDIHVIDSDLEVLWIATSEEVINYLEDIDEENK